MLDNLLARGLDPTLPRLFIVDGAKALSKAIRNTFGVAAAIQRCQVHKGRNIIERLPQHLHASVKKALRQAWDQDDANKAERLLRNLVRRLEHEEPGVSGSILEGLEEILTVIRLGLPHELRRSLACTNIVENALGTVRQVTRNVKRWRHAEMALDGPPPACWRLPSPQGMAAHPPKRLPSAPIPACIGSAPHVQTFDINIDCGESFGNWVMGADEALMPYVTTANLACGFHAGDPMIMVETVRLARQHGVAVGAHPGLPDARFRAPRDHEAMPALSSGRPARGSTSARHGIAPRQAAWRALFDVKRQ